MVLCALALLARPMDAQDDPAVMVFAASSLTEVLGEIEAEFEAQSGDALLISYASSAALARQIEYGAPADLFISANALWMDELEKHALLEDGSRFDLLRNSLVIIAHDEDAASVSLEPESDMGALLGDGRLAMAQTDSVPAGIYGKAALEALGLWDDLSEKILETDNVRAVLNLVKIGEAPYGIVYKTDALSEPSVKVVAEIPASLHAPIVYPVGDINTRESAAENAFLDYLKSPEARVIFERYGFEVVGGH